MNKITVYDTTLRDGMQGIEVSFTLQDKLAISHALDDIGVDYIEGGFPLSNEKEEAFFNQVKKEKFSHAKIVAFGSTRHAGKKGCRGCPYPGPAKRRNRDCCGGG